METILIDTDVIIDFLRGYTGRIRNVFAKIENKQIKAYISTITVVELSSGEDTDNKKKREILAQLLLYFEVIPLDTRLSQEAGLLRRKYTLGLADSVIAATSLSISAPLFTFNTQHFQKIPKLSLYRP